MNTSAPVLVALGPTGGDAALRYAAGEAVRVDAPLHVVHVLQIPGTSAMAAGVYVDVAAEARALLDKVTQQAQELVDGRVAVTSEHLDGPGSTAATLVAATDRGSQIVLEHRHLSRVRRIFAGSTVNGVGARAKIPVVSVPEGWQEDLRRPHVTAAVQDTDEAATILRTAFEVAARRQASLTILHSWWLDSGYDVVAVDDEYREHRTRQFQEALAPIAESLRAEFPDVAATVEVVHAPPTEALQDAAAQSSLLVVGRRSHLLPLGTHLGPVSRAVLDRSECPVIVAPEPR